MPMRTAGIIAVVLAGIAGLPQTADAASCRDQLRDFERRLNESQLAAEDPDAYADLLRRADELATLRDETLCARRLAELVAELPPDPNTARPGDR